MKEHFSSKPVIVAALFIVAALSGCSVEEQTSDSATYEPRYSGSVATSYSDEPVSDDTFFNELAPYGRWVNTPEYGRVWVPDAGNNFEPYRTNGHWVYSDLGWTWVSDYAWGWAPFHYGRWSESPQFGWYWVPGHTWGPAWVAWRHSDSYYGWAPLGPEAEVGVHAGFWSIPARHWCFVESNHFCEPHIERYFQPAANNAVYINNTTIINNYHIARDRSVSYSAGPVPAEVARYTGRQVAPVSVEGINRPSSGFAGVQNQKYMIVNPRQNFGQVRSQIPDHRQVSAGIVAGVPSRVQQPVQQHPLQVQHPEVFQRVPQVQPQHPEVFQRVPQVQPALQSRPQVGSVIQRQNQAQLKQHTPVDQNRFRQPAHAQVQHADPRQEQNVYRTRRFNL